jgi:hypothetical protein
MMGLKVMNQLVDCQFPFGNLGRLLLLGHSLSGFVELPSLFVIFNIAVIGHFSFSGREIPGRPDI